MKTNNITYPNDALWSEEAPNKPGLWWLKCMETNETPTLTLVRLNRNELWGFNDHDNMPICFYQDCLTDVFWKPATLIFVPSL